MRKEDKRGYLGRVFVVVRKRILRKNLRPFHLRVLLLVHGVEVKLVLPYQDGLFETSKFLFRAEK